MVLILIATVKHGFRSPRFFIIALVACLWRRAQIRPKPFRQALAIGKAPFWHGEFVSPLHDSESPFANVTDWFNYRATLSSDD
jgi:hypothetical protein